jgi:hypothetical protein
VAGPLDRRRRLVFEREMKEKKKKKKERRRAGQTDICGRTSVLLAPYRVLRAGMTLFRSYVARPPSSWIG